MVVPEEHPANYLARGFSSAYLSRYFGGCAAARTLVLSPQAGPAIDAPDLSVPALPGIEPMQAWLHAAHLLPHHVILDRAALAAGWPGIPSAWLEYLRQQRPSWIRAYGARWSAWVAIQIGEALQLPVVASVHNVHELSRDILPQADVVIAVSEAVASACIAAGCDPGRVVTIFNRVDRELFSPQGEAAPGPEGSPRLLCVARDAEQKNFDRLLAACASLLPRFPGLRLVHAGKSSRDWSKWPFVTHLESIPHVRLPAWMRWADAFVLPSLWEGFGIVFAESLACGLPVITSNRAPMNEIVTDRWDGLLCDPENTADIARAIAELCEPATRARLAAPARTASEPYDIAVIEAREAALYRTLLNPQWPKLSVVLPTYNRRHLIEAAVRNVLAQDYANLELIVVDDGSSDGTAELLDSLCNSLGDARLRVLHIPNGGLPRALNKGFAHASGELLSWTSDDNAYRPGALKAMARELLLDPAVGMVFADYEIVSADGTRTPTRAGPASELAARNVIGACFLYRTQIARDVGAYNEELALAEDWDYWRRIAAVSRLYHLKRTLYDYGDTPDSLSRTRPADVMAAAMKVRGVPIPWTPEYHSHMVRLAGAYKTQGLPGRALAAGLRIVRHKPLSASGYKAVVRALVPMPLLRMFRRVRGADAG